MKISASHVNTHQRASTTEEALNQADKMTQTGACAFVNGYHTTGTMDT